MNVSVQHTATPDGDIIKHPNKTMTVLKREDREPIKDSQFNRISSKVTKYVDKLYGVK